MISLGKELFETKDIDWFYGSGNIVRLISHECKSKPSHPAHKRDQPGATNATVTYQVIYTENYSSNSEFM